MEKIISEGKFLEKIEQFENEEQMLSYLKENGLTEEEAREVARTLEESWNKAADSEELGEDALEEVSGGIRKGTPRWWPWPKKWPPFGRPKGWPWVIF